MDGMGYRNASKVYDLASKGMLSREVKGNMLMDSFAMNVLQYMALSAIDWEDEASKKHHPARCYWKGWEPMIADMGLTLPTPEQAKAISEGNLNIDAFTDLRYENARVRVSRAVRFLRERRLVKQLITPQKTRRNAVWLLNLGDERENDEVETFARWKLGMPAFSDYAMDDHES